ncbi:hypothetical protein JCM8097_006544 [Rhodosporidiobolus ruineniae]
MAYPPVPYPPVVCSTPQQSPPPVAQAAHGLAVTNEQKRPGSALKTPAAKRTARSPFKPPSLVHPPRRDVNTSSSPANRSASPKTYTYSTKPAALPPTPTGPRSSTVAAFVPFKPPGRLVKDGLSPPSSPARKTRRAERGPRTGWIKPLQPGAKEKGGSSDEDDSASEPDSLFDRLFSPSSPSTFLASPSSVPSSSSGLFGRRRATTLELVDDYKRSLDRQAEAQGTTAKRLLKDMDGEEGAADSGGGRLDRPEKVFEFVEEGGKGKKPGAGGRKSGRGRKVKTEEDDLGANSTRKDGDDVEVSDDELMDALDKLIAAGPAKESA